MSRRRRKLSDEERELWKIVAQTVAPLHVEPVKPAPAAPPSGPAVAGPPPPPAPLNRKKKAASVETAPPPAPATAKPSHPPLHPIERRTFSRVARGTVGIDGRIDLHGMTQLDAHDRLRGFLFEAQARGAKLVLVITGKGRNDGMDTFGVTERGVLRRRVPHWLAEPGLRTIVLGFQEAHQTHGGGGALYVRIRKKRGAE